MRQLKFSNSITNRDSFSLDKYLQEISQNALLKADEEAMLAKNIRNGCADSLDILVKSNLRFVVSVAKQFQGQGLLLNDLINEGNLGLIRAAQKFDETRGFKFISYAVWWIRQSISQAIVEQSKVIRIPVNKAAHYSKITKTFQLLEQEYQRDPGIENVALKSGYSEDEISEYLQHIVTTVSTESTVSDGIQKTIGESLYDMEELNPEEILAKQNVENQIDKIIDTLTEREQDVICMYFGLRGFDSHTLEEIGQKIDLTRERVRQIKEKCLLKLKKNNNDSLLKSYPLK